jgi:hypothetical protein
MADFKSRETVLGELQTFLKTYNRQIDTGQNSLTKDFVLLPQSVGGSLVFEQIETVNDQFILSQQSSAELDLEGTNYKLERSAGTFAVVTATFYTGTVPTTDIFIPAGTQIQTAGTSFVSPVVFETVADYSVALSAVSNFYSYDRNRYEFPVLCTAESTGSTGNVGTGTITSISGSVAQISGVTNLTASSGGTDAESDEDFRSRIQNTKTGRDINTVNGLTSYVQSENFIDAYAVRVEDADSERATGVDVFIIDTYITAATQTFTYQTHIPRYYFENLPIVSVSSVESSVSGVLSTSDYDVNIDNSSPLRRSSLAQDYIEIRASASLTPGTTFEVTYTYRADIAQLQSTLERDDNNVLTADPLAKHAYPLSFIINATLTLKTNADGPATRNRVRNALIQFLATYRLGQDIQKSDIIIVLQEGYGDFAVDSVDAVVINEYYLQDEFGVNYTPVDEVISVTNKQYVVSGTATIL